MELENTVIYGSGDGVFDIERVAGIEPAYRAWEARVLPLNYTRKATGIIATHDRDVKRAPQYGTKPRIFLNWLLLPFKQHFCQIKECFASIPLWFCLTQIQQCKISHLRGCIVSHFVTALCR
jgi:hypothetical protein